jgi:transposase InsO family protein
VDRDPDPAAPRATVNLTATVDRVLVPPPNVPFPLTEPVHRQRLLQALVEGHTDPQARDPAWQQPRRQLEALIRADAVACWENSQAQGFSAADAAAFLGVPPRTLRHWRCDLRASVTIPFLGRPHARCTPDQGQVLVGFLQVHGPWVGVPTLRAACPDAPRAEVRELLNVFRYLWARQHPREQQVLNWHRPGAVWAMDFTEVSHPIDDCFPYVFAVRDLASGLQLAWEPVADPTTAAVLPVLRRLFTVAGAPLVLKSDNGSAFRADHLKWFLRDWQVWLLYSPPGRPGYNGAIEASIGSLKTRTQYAAYRAGHEGAWTTADLDAARDLANSSARPRGPKGPTPAEIWEARRAPRASEREAFAAQVGQAEATARQQEGIAVEALLDHYEQAALHRRVLPQVLMEGGYLTIRRRRIPQRFFGRKAANIT